MPESCKGSARDPRRTIAAPRNSAYSQNDEFYFNPQSIPRCGTRESSYLLFQVICQRYQKARSILPTSNKAFGEWGLVFADDAGDR
jgi:hypothetical protein